MAENGCPLSVTLPCQGVDGGLLQVRRGEASGHPGKEPQEGKASLSAKSMVLGQVFQTAEGQVGSRSEAEGQVSNEST